MSILFVLFSNHLLGQNEVRLKKAKKKKKSKVLSQETIQAVGVRIPFLTSASST